MALASLRRLSGSLIAAIMTLALFLAAAGPAVADTGIRARTAVVINAADGRILYGKNPTLKVMPASTTKLMTAMVALDRLNPDAVTMISATAAETPSVPPRVRAGERYRIRDLLHLALMRSVNSAAVALAEAAAGSEDAFAAMMNNKAAEIGASDTRFINASGLPGEGQQITAINLAGIMKHALGYPLIKEIINTRTAMVYSQDGRRLPLANTNHLLITDDSIGGKTGYTRDAGHCLVSAAEKGGSLLVSVVLGEHVRNAIWDDSRAIVDSASDVLAKNLAPVVYRTEVDEGPVVMASYKKSRAFAASRTALAGDAAERPNYSAPKKYRHKSAKVRASAARKAANERRYIQRMKRKHGLAA